MLTEADIPSETPTAEAPVVAPEPAVSPEPAAAPEGDSASEASAEPKTLLEAALNALKPKESEAPAQVAEPTGETLAADTGPAKTPETEAPTGETRDGVPLLPEAVFKALPKEAKQTVIALRKQAETLRPAAERGEALSTFLSTTGITVPEYNELTEVGVLLKHDLPKAREKIVAKLAEIDRALGIALPDHLREEVEQGFMPEDRARELSQAQAALERTQRTQQAQAAQQAEHQIVSELTAWETEARRADPDLFDRVLPDIQAKVRLAVMEAERAGKPVRTGPEAVRIARKAHEDMVTLAAAFRPVPKATPASPSSAASAPATAPVPKNIYEAAAAGLARAR